MSTIQVTQLDNGLRVASDSMADVESVTVGVWVNVGARDEYAEINGITHLIEHMMFKGTSRHSAFDISATIESVGGYINAYTNNEYTAYHAKVLSDDLPLAVDLIADILQHSVIDTQELKREQEVILQEIGRSLDTPDDIIFDHFQTTAYPDQAIGRPVLGSKETISTMERQTLLNYMRRHYNGQSMVLAAAGKVDHTQLVDCAMEVFKDLESYDGPTIHDSASYQGGDYRETRPLEQIHLLIGFEGLKLHSPDRYTISVLSALTGGSMSSRLFQEIRERRGLVYSIHSFHQCYSDSGLFGIYAGTSAQNLQEVIDVLCDQLAQIADTLSESEMNRARKRLIASTLMSAESSSARCGHLAAQLLLFNRPIPLQEIVDKIKAVDIDAVSRIARQVYRSKPTVAALGPTEAMASYDSIANRLLGT